MMKKVLLFFLLTALILNASGQKSYNVKDIGASGDGKTLDTDAIQKTIDRCYADSGGIVFFPPGTYVSGTLQLKSNVTLNIGKGTILQGSKNLSDYPMQQDTNFNRKPFSRYVFLHCAGMHDVSITGDGIIDGIRLEDSRLVSHGRGPMAILFENTDNICVSGITIRNAANWSLTFFGCKGVVARDVKVLNSRFDGINPVSSSDVLLDACIIDGSGDDPITIKNEGTPACGHVVKDVIIRNCIVRNTSHPAIKIGTGTAGIFRNIQVTGCIFENTGDVFSIELMRPSLSINPERVIENIIVTDIIAKNVRRFVNITTIGVDKPVIRNLHFNNIVIDEARNGSCILGTPEAPIHDIVIENVFYRSRNGKIDSWLTTDYIDGLIMRNLDLQLNENVRSVLDFKNGSKLRIADIDIAGIQSELPLFQLTQAKDVRIKTGRASHQFPEVSVEGNGSEDISLLSDFPVQEQHAIVSGEVKAGSIYPEASGVEILGVKESGAIKAGEQGNLKVSLHNKGVTGMYKLQAYEDKYEIGSRWLWLNEDESGEFSLDLKPIYQPGRHKVEIQGLAVIIEILPTPARIVVNDTMKITNEPKNEILTLQLQNTGGKKGLKTLTLLQNGEIADELTVELAPGEIKNAELKSRDITDKALALKIEGFPEWHYQTTFTVKSDFYFTTNGHIIIDAGGRLGVHEDYGAVYLNDWKGDFDAVVKFGSQQVTGEYASIGMIVRNELTDTTSNGFTVYTKVLKYGGYYVWRKDLDGDGKFDQRSNERGGDWYKLSKRDKTFCLYTSSDGNQWNKVGMEYPIESANRIQDVGIFGNAYNNKVTNRVSFDYFKVSPPGN